MAIAFVKATAGETDATGPWSYTITAPAAAGNLIIVQVFQDATSANNAISITSATNVENLAGTDNVFTALAATGSDVGSAAAGYQYIFIGRALNLSAIVITGGNSGADDIYIRAYEFSGVVKGTTLATVIENSTAGSFANGAGTSTTCADTGVTTLGADRLALNFVALADDAMGLAAFAGQSGGTWALPVAIYETATGTDATLGLNTAPIAVAGTINGGTDAITSIAWGVIGFALIPEFSPTVVLNSPADASSDSDTTPTLDFTGTDANGDSIQYDVQVDTVNTFNSVVGGFDLKTVDLKLGKVGSPTDNLFLEVRSTISGTALGTSENLAAANIPGVGSGGSVFTFTFAAAITLTHNTKYYLVLKRTGAGDLNNACAWFFNNAGNVYTGGGLYTNDSGTWSSEHATFDDYFVLYDVLGNAQITQATGTSWSGNTVTGGTQVNQEIGQSFIAIGTAPLINARSATDPGFVNPDTPADTHPFNSGENIQYTVQSALTVGTYYWRVRGLDPAGSNTYGAWATTRRFTVTGGSLFFPQRRFNQAVHRASSW